MTDREPTLPTIEPHIDDETLADIGSISRSLSFRRIMGSFPPEPHTQDKLRAVYDFLEVPPATVPDLSEPEVRDFFARLIELAAIKDGNSEASYIPVGIEVQAEEICRKLEVTRQVVGYLRTIDQTTMTLEDEDLALAADTLLAIYEAYS